MKIDDIKGPTKNLNIDLKIIYDQMPVKQMYGKNTKTIVVADIDSVQGDATALLDLYDKDVETFKFGMKIRVVNGYGKLITTHRKGLEVIQPMINYGFAGGNLLGHYEVLE